MEQFLIVAPYGAAALSAVTTSKATTILVYGSEFGKGTYFPEAGTSGQIDARGANEPDLKVFH